MVRLLGGLKGEEWKRSGFRRSKRQCTVVQPERNAANQEQCLREFGFGFLRNMKCF